MDHWLVTLAEAKAAPIPEGARSALLMQHGTMTLRYYAPRGRDPQTPHAQDEIYVVVAGSGTFALGRDGRHARAPALWPGRCHFAPGRLGPPLRGLHRRLRHLGRVLGPQGGEAQLA